MFVTVANIGLSHVLESCNNTHQIPAEIMKKRRNLLWIDVGIKMIGFTLALTVYPRAMMLSVILAAAFLMISIQLMHLDWSDVIDNEEIK